MTPAAIYFCTTLVTAVPHGSVAQHDCRFVEPPFTGTRASALEVPVQSAMNTNVPAPASTSIVAPPATRISDPIAKPISKPVVRIAKLYQPKIRRRVAHLTTFRRYGKIVVSPTASESSDRKEQYSFWDKLKRFDLFK